jgi:hypothetical protein
MQIRHICLELFPRGFIRRRAASKAFLLQYASIRFKNPQVM